MTQEFAHTLASIGSLAPAATSGIVNGSVYGLVAVGFVLVYKLDHIFNFAQAEFGSIAGVVAMALVSGLGPFPKVPMFLAILIGIGAGVLTAALVERFVVRPLRSASRAAVVVATAGVALFLIGIQAVLLGVNIRVFPKIGGQSRFSLFGKITSPNAYVFGYTEIVVVLSLVVIAALAVLFFRSRYGVAIRGTAEEPIAASLVGVEPERMSALTWMLAGLVGAIAGVIYAPFSGAVTPGFVTGLFGVGPLVLGFIAAVVGGMSSIPGAFVGGILVGIINALAGRLLPSGFPGGGSVVMGALLILVLLIRPSGLMGKTT